LDKAIGRSADCTRQLNESKERPSKNPISKSGLALMFINTD